MVTTRSHALTGDAGFAQEHRHTGRVPAAVLSCTIPRAEMCRPKIEHPTIEHRRPSSLQCRTSITGGTNDPFLQLLRRVVATSAVSGVWPDDRDRAGGLVHQGVADGAEQQAGELTAAT